MSDMSLKAINERVLGSMCWTSSFHDDGIRTRKEARISEADWAEVCKALSFYAKHEHWMSLGEDGPRTLLVAQGDKSGVDGWTMAEGIAPEPQTP